MDKEQVAADIGGEINGYRTYSGTRKWWRGRHNDLTWKVNLKTDDDLLWVRVTPGQELDSDSKKVTFEAEDDSFKYNGGEVKYTSASDFVRKATTIAKQSLEERILREAIQKIIKQTLL